MLDVARKKFRPDEPVEFHHADAMALPFSHASFDVVVCQFSVMFFPEKDKSYREAYRVLAPGVAMYSASGTATTTGMAASPMKSRPNFSQAIRRNSIG
jgi:ubiquinone/menaquinone biosynthesis C-methylase UbiE